MSENTNSNSNDWFESWFDTEYYHILYKERNDEEAQLLMDNLTQYLNLPEEARILDLACGKGRHAIYLNSLGYDVTGIDLSENSITEASAYANEKLHFKVHDMRETCDEKYDAIFNLFTSFGYFDEDDDNLKTLKAIHNSLTETGFAVIDFMNADYVIDNLVPEEIKTALRLADFEKMMEEAGIYLLDIFGDYKLKKFFKTQSERLIMIFK